MSYKHTIEAALENLNEIDALIRNFPKDSKIPALDLDLTFQKVRNLYEVLLMLRENKNSNEYDIAVKVAATRIEELEHITTEPKKEAPVENKAADEHHSSKKQTKVLSDRFKISTSLHDSLHEVHKQKEPVAVIIGKPISDIGTAIGINDRFTFLRELFNNDVEKYEETIKELNDKSNFNDAYNYMTQHFDWDMDSDAVQLLLEIIRRKFITGKNE